MKKFRLEESFIQLFPNAEIGVLVCNGIDNHVVKEDKYASYLRVSEMESQKFFENPEFIENPVIKEWREAFYKFKTKKGARCSIEALLKRVSKGGEIGCINPLVDIYNGVSLRFGLPIGGENLDKFEGDMRLTIAEGGEDFTTYGSDKNEPALEGEVIYRDDYGAICRCWNWREAVRTMLTEDVTNAFMIIETSEGEKDGNLNAALDFMAEKIQSELGGTVKKFIVSKENPEIVIAE